MWFLRSQCCSNCCVLVNKCKHFYISSCSLTANTVSLANRCFCVRIFHCNYKFQQDFLCQTWKWNLPKFHLYPWEGHTHKHTKIFNAYHVCLFDCPCAPVWCAPVHMYFIKQLSVINISPRILGKTVKYFSISTYAVITPHHVISNLAIGMYFSNFHHPQWSLDDFHTEHKKSGNLFSTEHRNAKRHSAPLCNMPMLSHHQKAVSMPFQQEHGSANDCKVCHDKCLDSFTK